MAKKKELTKEEKEKKKLEEEEYKKLSFKEKRERNLALLGKSVRQRFGENAFSSGGVPLAFRSTQALSTGVLILDYAMGGGVPRSRTTMFFGSRSSSKTTTICRIMGLAQKTDARTGRFLEELKGDDARDASPMSIAFIDVEGTYDAAWAAKLGVDSDALGYSRPKDSEEAQDIIDSTLRSGAYDIVVVDSLAALIPQAELHGSMSELQVGKAGFLNAKMFRKVQSAINAVMREDNAFKPTLILTNQLRSKVGVFFGSPEIKPGGLAQDFFTSLEVKFSAGATTFYDPDDKKLPKETTFNFVVTKNKLGPPKISGEFIMQNVDDPSPGGLMAGEINDRKQILQFAEKVGIYVNLEKGFQIYDQVYKTKGELWKEWFEDVERLKIIRRDVVSRLFSR
jgi:recombination protein RecA